MGFRSELNPISDTCPIFVKLVYLQGSASSIKCSEGNEDYMRCLLNMQHNVWYTLLLNNYVLYHRNNNLKKKGNQREIPELQERVIEFHYFTH